MRGRFPEGHRAMTILSVGDGVRPGLYVLHSRFRRTVNFTDGRRIVSLVARSIGPGPDRIVVRGPLPGRGEHLLVGRPETGPRAGPRYESRLATVAGRRPVPRENLACLERVLLREAHPLSLAFLLDPAREAGFRTPAGRAVARRIRRGAGLVRVGLGEAGAARLPPRGRGALVRGVRMIAGCGFGLTPSGDDFNAGLLTGLAVGPPDSRPRGGGRARIRAARDLVYAAARRRDLFADHFLRAAYRGRAPARTKALIAALADGRPSGVTRGARALLAVGETSGADFLTGFLFALRRGMGVGHDRPR
jgi:hypothetical protein